MAYATVTQLRDYLKQVGTGAAKDAELQTAIDRAHETVNDALGFTFAAWAGAATDRDLRNTSRGPWLVIPYHKPGSVVTVETLYGRGTPTASLEVVNDWIEEDDGRLYLDRGWGTGWYRIEAIWGYGPVPANVVEVELQLAVNLWRGKDRGMYSDVIGVEGGGAVAYQRSLTNLQRMIVDDVRRRYLGVIHA